MLERLAAQKLEPKDLRTFLRLGDPLASLNEEEMNHKCDQSLQLHSASTPGKTKLFFSQQEFKKCFFTKVCTFLMSWKLWSSRHNLQYKNSNPIIRYLKNERLVVYFNIYFRRICSFDSCQDSCIDDNAQRSSCSGKKLLFIGSSFGVFFKNLSLLNVIQTKI